MDGMKLPPIHRTRNRVQGIVVTFEESQRMDRWYADVWHSGSAEVWEHRYSTMGIHSPDPQIISEIETSFSSALEDAVVHRFGIQAVLL